MKLKIQEKQTGHLMTDLGISSERCEELCDVIDTSIMQLHNEGRDKVTLAEVVEKALTHSQSDNETVFICITAGEYHAKYINHVEGMALSSLRDLFKDTRTKASVFN